jgi:hypothetical protein
LREGASAPFFNLLINPLEDTKMTEEVQTTDDQFPTLVYKGHGPHSRAGGTYDYTAANDQEELDAKLADGWFTTLPEAIDAHDKPAVVKTDDAPPTRAELETKAKELGIQFGKKTTDAELSASITKALAKE